MANNDKNGVFKNTHFLLAYSGINRMKAFQELVLGKMNEKKGAKHVEFVKKNVKMTQFWA